MGRKGKAQISRVQPAAKVVSFRFLSPGGPWREHLMAWATGNDLLMHPPMYRELMGYATALVSMQRLEGRHSVLKRELAWQNFRLPSSLSAAMRRRQNRDLENPEFSKNLHEYLAGIGTLHQGHWECKTQLLETFSRASGQASHDPLTLLTPQRDMFVEELSKVCTGPRLPPAALQLQREHLKACMVKGSFYAIPGLLGHGRWALFRLLHLSPGGNMYLQKACHLAEDEASSLSSFLGELKFKLV